MCSYLQKHKILHQSQSRFRPGHTPKMYNYVASVDDWRRGLDNNHLVGVVLVDLSKAFDLSIMICCSVRWINMGYKAKKSAGSIAILENCWNGSFTGINSQPFLFTLFVNDLPKILGNWGLRSLISYENGDPGSPFSLDTGELKNADGHLSPCVQTWSESESCYQAMTKARIIVVVFWVPKIASEAISQH